MFEIVTIKDQIKISLISLNKSLETAVMESLEERYVDRVVDDVGLGILPYDILDVKDPIVYPGKSDPVLDIKFRLVVFRPFIDEILTGTIKKSTSEMIYISVGFFNNIHLPPSFLQPDSLFDKELQTWYWRYQNNRLYMRKNKKIRIRVVSESFRETHDTRADASTQGEYISPYTIMASIAEDGLGMLDWWEDKAP